MGMLPYYGIKARIMELRYHSMSGFPNCGRFSVYNGPYMETEYQDGVHFFSSYKNLVYKNVEAQICLKFKNIVVILLVAN